MIARSRKFLSISVLATLVLVILPACSTNNSSTGLHLMPMDQMPAEVQTSPSVVRTAYQFTAANPDMMKSIPCYCGCGGIGHTSNYSCYVSDIDAQGKISFDSHALGCSICVDITQDVMRMLREGKSPQEAKAYVDMTYSKYGPSNIP